MGRAIRNQKGFAAMIGIVIAAILLLVIFVFVTRGGAVTNPEAESNVQNPDKYQEDVDAALTKAAENKKELYELER